MKLSDLRFLVFVGLSVCVLGCSSNDKTLGKYTSPRIKGRVVDAKTGVPLERVIVHRNPSSKNSSPADRPHGAQAQSSREVAYSDKNGQYSFPSKKTLSIGGDKTWSGLQLRFVRSDYITLTTNFVNKGDSRTNGVPFLELGEIELRPLSEAPTDR